MCNKTIKQKLDFVSAIRTHQHHVAVTYRTPETDDEFTVEWSNINPETGAIESRYDLDVLVRSDNNELADRVSEAIKEGESDDNPDLDLYLSIRDDFDATDVAAVENLLTDFDINYHSSKKHSSSNMSEYVRHNLDIFNEVNGLQAVYQSGLSYYHGDYSLPSTEVLLSEDGGTNYALSQINDLDESYFDNIDEDYIKDLNCAHITTKEQVIETYWLIKHNNKKAAKLGDAYEPDVVLLEHDE